MKVSGFTIVRNAVQFDYPIVQSIESILPLCDELIVMVGNSSDKTLELVQSISSPKIKIYESIWDDTLKEGGKVLAVETDKAYAKVSEDSDWAFYIQADEILHEQYIPTVREAMTRYKDNSNVDGLLFNYHHFYGSYDYLGDSYRWYRREIRIIRKRADIYSYRDAQGFRMKPNHKLRVVHIPATIYHYGWVRHPSAMYSKQFNFNKLYFGDSISEQFLEDAEFDYSKITALRKFEGTHPAVMKPRINALNWKFSFDPLSYQLKFKDRFKRFFVKLLGWQPGEYRNYRIIDQLKES